MIEGSKSERWTVDGSYSDLCCQPVSEPFRRGPRDRMTVDRTIDEATALTTLRDLAVRREVAHEGLRRAARLADDAAAAAGVGTQFRRPPPRLRHPRWGWRRAIAAAVDKQMFSPDHVAGYRRLVGHRARAALRGEEILFRGVAMTGRGVQLRAAVDQGRVVVGPWCWLGNATSLRCHEGQLVLGAKVVVGTQVVANVWQELVIGEAAILADWIYICDFDHRTDRLDVPIKDQGIVTTPVRVGEGSWIGAKATILRGADIGLGSVVGAHAVVRDSLPPFSIAVGMPARSVGSRLPDGMEPGEAAGLALRGLPIPGDPIED